MSKKTISIKDIASLIAKEKKQASKKETKEYEKAMSNQASKYGPRPVKVPSKAEVSKTIKDEEKLRILSREILGNYEELSSEEIIDMLESFSRPGETYREYMIKQLLIFPRKSLKEFLRQFSGGDKEFEKIHKNIMKTLSTKTLENIDEIIEEEEAEKRDKKVEKLIQGMHTRIEFKPTGKQTKLVSLEGEEIIEEEVPKVKANFLQKVDSGCLSEYRYRVWIPQYSRTFLSSPYGHELEQDYVLPQYKVEVTESSPSVIYKEDDIGDPQIFYQANKKFDILLCSYNNFRNRQNGRIFTAYDNEGKAHHFIVAYRLMDGKMLIQDEKIYAQERRYFKEKDEDITETVNNFMTLSWKDNGQITESVIDACNNILVEAINYSLSKIDSEDFEKFTLRDLEKVSELILSNDEVKTIGDIIEAYVIFLVIINPLFFGDYAKILRNRLKTRYISLSSIFKLDPKFIFEDFLKNPDIFPEDKKSFLTNFGAIIQQEIKVKALQIYKYLHPHIKGNFDVGFIPISRIVIPKGIRTHCSPELDYLPNYLLSYYLDMENNTIYCFDTKVVYDQITSGNLINHYTGREFSPDFLEEIREIDEDKLEEYYHDYLYKDNNQVVFEIPDEEEEEIEEEIVEAGKMQGPYIESLYQSVLKLEEEFTGNQSIPKSVKCEYCQRHIGSRSFTTIVNKDGENKVINFCRSECLVDWEEPESDEGEE